MKELSPVTLLYVEDEEADRFLMERAFLSEGRASALHMVDHGRAAIDYLSGNGMFPDRTRYPMPRAVLLDLNLPEVHGFDVLKWIRSHPAVSNLPVMVFSSSVREDDRMRAKLLGATEFIQKPCSPTALREIVSSLIRRWLQSPSTPPVVSENAALPRVKPPPPLD
jgi:CheY-like chemotaxis protein